MTEDSINKAQKGQQPPPLPTVLSINICDSIIRDESTKKVSLIGLFSIIRANSFPCTHPLMHIYIALTNGHGKCKTEVRFTRLDDDKPIAGMIGELQFQNPLQVVELNLCWQQLVFDRPGEYAVEVLCESKDISSRKFIVTGPEDKILPTSGTEVR
jgi:hypothetical protein